MSGPTQITSDVLSGFASVRHGFFTAEGGVSMGAFRSLNCSPSSGDAPAAIAENRARVADCLGIQAASLVSLQQVHSTNVYYVRDPADFQHVPQGDGMVTDQPGIGLGVLGADCAPVLFVDQQAGVIGAAHSGWKGALTGISDAVVKAMCERGAVRARICAAIGPAMQAMHYEIQTDFYDRFIRESPIPAEPYFYMQADRMTFDTPAYVEARLKALGLMQIDRSHEDTYTQPERFFSFRRSVQAGTAQYGRQIAAITLV